MTTDISIFGSEGVLSGAVSASRCLSREYALGFLRSFPQAKPRRVRHRPSPQLGTVSG